MKNLIGKREKDRIDSICEKYNITDYTINSDGSIDSNQHIDFVPFLITEIPLTFRNVYGSFYCNSTEITSLVGCPILVKGDFFCGYSNLTSLVGAPATIGGNFSCVKTDITNLVGFPAKVGKTFTCIGNNLMTSTYAGDIDPEIGNINSFTMNKKLPDSIQENQEFITTILAYQRHFEIWNNDLTLNEENFTILLDEIKDGLE